MTDCNLPNLPSVPGEVRRPTQYKTLTYHTIQFKEVIEHKYYRSKEKQYDFGMEASLWDWVKSKHAERFEKVYAKNYEKIKDKCKQYCPDGKCRGRDLCPLTMDDIHKLLGD